jgi:magnesium transporter
MGHVVDSNTRWLLKKEIAIGFINGVLWASVVSLVTFAWFQSVDIALIIGAALIVNMVVAAAAGIIVPLALQKMNIDPAISGAVVLTTVTDVIGFMAFLGLASIFLI